MKYLCSFTISQNDSYTLTQTGKTKILSFSLRTGLISQRYCAAPLSRSWQAIKGVQHIHLPTVSTYSPQPHTPFRPLISKQYISIMPAAIIPRDDDPSTPILALDAFPPTGEPEHKKLSSWDLYASMGSPKYVVAPMVDQSELAWRILSRRHGAQLVYTPMINSRRFSQMTATHGPEHDVDFWIAKDKALQEEGARSIEFKPGESSAEGLRGSSIDTDEPVIVQFCGNDPELLLQSAKIVEPYCQAVDLNLGCPQHIAKRGHYGSFLQSDWQLIFRLINILHINLKVPVTAKMRVFDCVDRTVAYAQMLERAGAQIITVHGRTREMKGHNTGLADWEKIKAVKKAVKVPVLANGNILYHEDIQRALNITGADGVMSAEGNLYNPTIFANAPTSPTDLFPLSPAFPFPRLINLIREYLDICERLHTPTAGSAIKAHLFRLARPALEVHRDLRPMLGQASLDLKATGKARFKVFYAFVDRLAELLEADETMSDYASKIAEAESKRTPTYSWQAATGGNDPDYVPHWLAQPYYRKTMPPKEEVGEAAEARKEKRKLRLEQTALLSKEKAASNSSGLTTINDIQAQDEENTMKSDNVAADADSNKRARVG